MALSVRTGWGGLAGLVVPLFLFISAAGFIVANSIVRALAGFSERAGAVSAPVGAFADGRGDRARRDRQPALRTTARSGPRARHSERNRKSRMSFSRAKGSSLSVTQLISSLCVRILSESCSSVFLKI
jgi:hypothetical protein